MRFYFNQIRDRRRAEGKEPGLMETGFTLIELLIVIVVLGILAAVVIFALGGVTGQSAQSACNADAKSVEVAVEAYHTQVGTWPTAGATAATQLTGTASVNGTTVGPWLRTFPSNGTHYTITVAAGGVVNVNGNNYDTGTNPCNSVS
jgi:prepilin-type N-terminal cleavage/methylation domain-containing protein